MTHYGYGMVPNGYLVVQFKVHKVYQVVLVHLVHLVIQVQVCGVPETSMGNIMFKKDAETGMFQYKFKRPNISNGIEWGPPDVYNKEASMRKADSAESTQWWKYMVSWNEKKDGLLADGSLVDVGFTVWNSPTNPKIKSVKLTRVGVIEAVVLDQAAA